MATIYGPLQELQHNLGQKMSNSKSHEKLYFIN